MYITGLTPTSSVWTMGAPIKSEPTLEVLIGHAIYAAKLTYWDIRIERPWYGKSSSYRREERGWKSICIVNYNKEEYSEIRKLAISMGGSCHKGRSEKCNETDRLMGGYEDHSVWFQFQHKADLEAMRALLVSFPERDAVMRVTRFNQETKELLKNVSAYVINGTRGIFLFYNKKSLGSTDEMLVTLACSAGSIKKP